MQGCCTVLVELVVPILGIVDSENWIKGQL